MFTNYKIKTTVFACITAILFGLTGCNAKQKPSEINTPVTEPVTSATDTVTKNTPAITPTTQANTPDLIKAKQTDQTPFNWLKVSGWHTQGTIAKNTPIKIIFNRDVVASKLIGKDASNNMHVTPKIGGKPVYKKANEIVWQPTEPLQSGQEYKVTIRASGLKNIPDDTPPFYFNFRVIPLEFEVKTLGLSINPNDNNQFNLRGELLTSDQVASKGVETSLKATIQGKSLPITWEHHPNGKQHKFTVNNIQRDNFTTAVALSWNGAPINIKQSGNLTVSIPARDTFNMTSMRVVHDAGSNPYVQVRFSDQLDPQQNTKGLIQLTRNKYKVRINGNIINIYPNKNLSGNYKVRINKGLKSRSGKILDKDIEKTVKFDDIKPQVRFVGNGSILPENATLEIPFEAVGVNAIDVAAMEIYPDNMGQFLQTNNLSGNHSVQRTGRYIWQKTIPLTPADPNQWNRYSFNVTELMKNYHAGLLRLTLTIRKSHSSYRCPAQLAAKQAKSQPLRNMVDLDVYEPLTTKNPIDNEGEDSYYDYDWEHRNDPCYPAYYGYYNRQKTQVSQNFIASNIGLIAKLDKQGKLHIISTDIATAEPLTGVDLEVKNFQGQSLGSAKSDGKGFAQIALKETPFVVVAKKFNDTAYLKVNAKNALPVSQFDVSGKTVQKGIKGVIYGERGVWRPGDNLYLTFVLQDKLNNIPEDHPVTMKLIDPQGRTIDTQTNTHSIGGFYSFKFKTDEKAPTGNWLAKAYLGGSTFTKSIKIETIRPNRLKIDLSFATESKTDPVIFSSDGPPKGKLFSQWLHGASASRLKADIAVKFRPRTTRFKRFPDYTFDDPARQLKSEEKILLEGYLDNSGTLEFQKPLRPKGNPPGMLTAQFTTRVFEKGGAFSISRNSFAYHPYANYIGLKLPDSQASYDLLYTDKKHTINITSVNAKGEAVSLDKVKVSLYKIDWRWWWDKPAESLAEFTDSKHTDLLQNTIVSTVDGKGQWDFSVKASEWGRYLVRVCDLEGKHCAGKTIYVDWPDWSGRAQQAGSTAASRLNLFTDKTAYAVGDTAMVQLPATTQGRALLTIETGSTILDQRWLTLKPANTNDPNQTAGKIQVEIPITAAMAPNAYVHISLLQAHKNKHNDRPIRLYGILSLEVADPATYLTPTLKTADEWRPQSKQTIKVSESNGKAMNYTLAVVDEGLLGLTAFRTPNLHQAFYSKEALGIKTWDLFDKVIGAYGGKLERMLALGGGDENEVDNEDSKKRRFPPVVRFMGPFHLEAGASNEHQVELPPYLGAVRVMLVAGEKGAYGKTQKSVFIRQPLMLQASMPRLLGPNESVAVPVTLFAMDDSVKDVSVTIETNDLIQLESPQTTQIHFDQTGEKLAFIKLRTANKIGKAHIHFVAQSGKHQSEADIYLDIRRPNKEVARSQKKTLEPDQNWSVKGKAFGLTGSNKAILEISSVPSLNLENRLNYLIRYPHGCLEQTTSSAFPQLYLSNVMQLDNKKQEESETNIKRAIERLRSFQRQSGNFSYWPGGSYANEWASVYAGHFLVEAQKAGYLIPADLLTDWFDYQINTAQNYIAGSDKYSHTQAYRLYVLALANKPQMGAMNRLREYQRLNNKARWLLAAAYQRASQPAAAQAVMQGLLPEVDPVNGSDQTFSSTLGDLGLQLEALVALNKKQDANLLLEKIATEMGSDKYQSTQGIAWALMGVSRYLGGDTSHFNAVLIDNENASNISSDKPFYATQLSASDAQINLKNQSAIKLFATLTNRGIPVAGDEQTLEQGLRLNVQYEVRDKENSKLWHFVGNNNIEQGSDTRITVSVKNISNRYTDNIALTIPVAAGMEILSASEQPANDTHYDYRDLRDDRIHYYFALSKGQTKTFQLASNATYQGHFYQPAIHVEAMYDGNMHAQRKGHWINIVNDNDHKSASLTQPQIFTVITPRAYLYDSPDISTKTQQYLIAGDTATLLNKVTDAENNLWLFIQFNGKKTLKKWVKANNMQ